jgi:hypothetical protein
MNHSDICSTSYNKKKGRESNWQFDSRPLKVGNRTDPSVCKWSAAHHWKALEEIYKFASNLIPIGGLSKELWTFKVPRIQSRTISGLLLGSPGKKCHSDVGAAGKPREYYMGEGSYQLQVCRVQLWWVEWVQGCPWLILTLKVFPNVN